MANKQLTTVIIAAPSSFQKLGLYKVQYNAITQRPRDLTDIYTLFLGHCGPSGVMRIYQSNPLQLYYNILIYMHTHNIDLLLQETI